MSANDGFDHGSLHFRQTLPTALVQVTERVLIQAQLVKDGGVDVA